MLRALPGLPGLFCLGLMAFHAPLAMASGEYWLGGGTLTPAPRVELSVPLTGTHAADAPLVFACVLHAQGFYPQTMVTMVIASAGGAEVARESITLTLYNGANSCRFIVPPEALPPGSYTVTLEADYPGDDPPAVAVIALRKVDHGELRARLTWLHGRLALLDAAAAAHTAERGARPYVHARVALLQLATRLAEEAISAGNLRDADAFAVRAEALSGAAHAQLAFSAEMPALGAPDAAHAVEVNDGAFVAGGRPVFLFGATLPAANPGAVENMARLGFNFAVAPLPPATAMGGAGALASLDAALRAAQDQGITVMAQLLPHDVGGLVGDHESGLAAKGFVNLARPKVETLFTRQIAAVAPFLASQPAVRMVSLAFEPRFAYESESARRQFIDYVRARYPVRHELNQAWRTHLANYEEITITGDFPDHDYHHKRAFQWDWQQFNKGLVQQYIQSAYNTFRAGAPALPATITLSNTVFDEGDSRRGIDREGLARMLEITGCTAALSPHNELYAYSYPDLSVFATLMRSMEPGKPVMCSAYRIEIDPVMTAADVYDYVYASTWDAVVSGLNGMALPADSPVFTRPEALEAYAMAALDINRLAPVVQAMQTAPAEVAILWSESARVLDDGEPYLTSTRHAYEGVSFSGYQVRFITEQQATEGALSKIKVLVIPTTPALRDDAFQAVQAYMEAGGVLAQVGTPIPYDEHGQSRQDLIRPTGDNYIVRGQNLPTEYLHAMDAILEVGKLEHIPRPINRHGYPLEGVKTRYVTWQGDHYVFVANLRKDPVDCYLAGTMHSGRDLITNQLVHFPRVLQPLEPMLILMNDPVQERVVTARTSGAP